MSFFLVVVFRLVIALSIPLVFIGALYCSLWAAQIYRAVRRGRTSGLTAEYLIGTTVCRLYYLLCKFFFSLSLCWFFYGVNWQISSLVQKMFLILNKDASDLFTPWGSMLTSQAAWVYGVVIFVVLQVTVIMLQEYFGPTLILPRGVCSCLWLVRHSRFTDIVFLTGGDY
jgi:transmembrane E3 ubiquitin-protein ligase